MRWILATLAGLALAPVQAQEAQESDEAAPEPRAEEAPLDDAGEGDALLEDYEASEQISEDLSVSFPVDI